jgi:predicted phage terminase large subunit-like protein
MCGPCAAYADKAVTILEEVWAAYPAKKHGGSEAEREAWRESTKELLSCLPARARQPKQEALVIASMIKGAKITGHTPPELVHYVVKEGDPVPPRAPTVREHRRRVVQVWRATNSAKRTKKKGTQKPRKPRAKGLLGAAVAAIENGEVPHRPAAPLSHLVTPVQAALPIPPEPPSDPVTKDVVLRELAARELARRKLLRFILRMYPQYEAGWFHIDLCERLEKFLQDVIDRKSPRLMLSVPPRHGKSFIVSEKFPAWALGRYPWLEFIGASYGQELANDFSFKVQQLIQSEVYQQLFPKTQLQEGRQSIETWRTTAGGQYMAAGAGGPMTGRGGHILGIDDPLKNRDEADSSAIRERLHRWYTSTAYTRLMPGGGVLITQTRWHDDDLAGRLETEYRTALRQLGDDGVWPEDADRWEIISYPAIATEDEKWRRKGEALHPERYNLAALNKIKRTLGPRDWAALYQQTPVPDEGGYFKAEWVRYADSMPDHNGLQVYAACDLAVSKKDSADFTVFVVVGVDRSDNIWVLDVRRGRWNAAEIIDQLFDVHRVWKPKLIGMEEGAILSAIGSFLDKRIAEEKLWDIAIEPQKIRGKDKESRARPIQGRMQQGMVYFPRNASWTAEAMNELLRFPAGTHDDIVDALGWIGQMLSSMSQRMIETKKLESWKDKLHEHVEKAAGGSTDWMAA